MRVNIRNDAGELILLDYLRAKLTRGKSRKVATCKRCKAEMPKGTMAFRPLVDSPAFLRCDRLCADCAEAIAAPVKPKRESGACPGCGRHPQLRTDGTIGAHKVPVYNLSGPPRVVRCAGTGRQPGSRWICRVHGKPSNQFGYCDRPAPRWGPTPPRCDAP